MKMLMFYSNIPNSNIGVVRKDKQYTRTLRVIVASLESKPCFQHLRRRDFLTRQFYNLVGF